MARGSRNRSNNSSSSSSSSNNNNSNGGSSSCSCCSNSDSYLVNRGPWSAEEDEVLSTYIKMNGDHHNWRKLPKAAGLLRCGKSCRLRWLNYLRPGLKHGKFSQDEEDLIIQLHSLIGNRWSLIAGRIPGRSDNEIKNFWNFHVSKKLLQMGVNPKTHKPFSSSSSPSPSPPHPPLQFRSSPFSSLSLLLSPSPSSSSLDPSPSSSLSFSASDQDALCFDQDDNSTSSSAVEIQALDDWIAELPVDQLYEPPSQLVSDGDWSFLQDLDLETDLLMD